MAGNLGKLPLRRLRAGVKHTAGWGEKPVFLPSLLAGGATVAPIKAQKCK
jgi:hypothetical protein